MIQIPLHDIRDKSLVDLLTHYSEKALQLIEGSKNTFGLISRMMSTVAFPIGDYLSRHWLVKTKNPYLAEIDEYARRLKIKGIYSLNMCYEWGCTSGVYTDGTGVRMIRVLDWPFPALGENIVIAHQKGAVGDFYNVTWPGISGVFQASAPTRFSAALNQAPMRRHKTGILIDWIRNRGSVHESSGLPPAHLLRQVFEKAKTYQEAKEMLMTEPVSIPVIYTLIGTNASEGCVIERIENRAVVRDLKDGLVCAANHFESSLNGIGYGWLPRSDDSCERSHSGVCLRFSDIEEGFGWFQPPIANEDTRLVMSIDMKNGYFSVMGTDGARPVTDVFRL